MARRGRAKVVLTVPRHARDRMHALRRGLALGLSGKGKGAVMIRLPTWLVERARRATGISRVYDLIIYALLKVIVPMDARGRLAARRRRRVFSSRRRFKTGAGR